MHLKFAGLIIVMIGEGCLEGALSAMGAQEGLRIDESVFTGLVGGLIAIAVGIYGVLRWPGKRPLEVG